MIGVARTGPTRRDSCYLKSILKIVYVYMRRRDLSRRDLSIVYPTSRLVRLEISHINATEGSWQNMVLMS